MNVAFVSHCGFAGNSAFHVLGIANALADLDHTCTICIPDDRPPAPAFTHASCRVITYDTAYSGSQLFVDAAGPTLIHAFTPREHVRQLTEFLAARWEVPYVVHLEDNEQVILADELGGLPFEQLVALPTRVIDRAVPAWRSHPLRARRFIEAAAGMTVLIDTLLEFNSGNVPAAVFWPGFDPSFLTPAPDLAVLRARLNVRADDLLVVYNGNVHASNVAEVRSLDLAVALLRRSGYPVRLLKTGWNHADMSWVAGYGLEGAVIDLGFVARAKLPGLLQIADALVQPGTPGPFNDYRFPSKLPEFLASAKPVVLPNTNLGRYLRDGEEALVMETGNASDIFDKTVRLANNPSLRARLGSRGQAFALKNLRWETNVATIVSLYQETAARASSRRPRPRHAETPANADGSAPVKLLAFYLPQFHPIPENDAWWGMGFTEWSNVSRALPQYSGHCQPRLPSDLGYYDLRLPEVVDQQAALATQYGVHGFCYYYYWFDGRRLLERPLDQVLARDEPSLPFCVCWANENWTRRWDGADDDVLVAQTYQTGWDSRFIHDLLPILADRRYVHVGGAPLLLIYRADLLPDARAAAATWRRIARQEASTELHLAAVQSFGITDPREFGFDAAVEFPPHTKRFLIDSSSMPGVLPSFEGYFEDYRAVMNHQLARPLPPYPWYRGVIPGWDNTPRRGSRAHILVGSTPQLYETWLRKLVLQTAMRSAATEPLIFINAWNEWAEGAYLEPDMHRGRAWLEATQSALGTGLAQYYASSVSARSVRADLGAGRSLAHDQ
jgi:glycosyltransferase involved in cell wall biosynthesis